MTDEEEFEEFQKKLAEEIKESIEFMNDFNERMKKIDKSEIKSGRTLAHDIVDQIEKDREKEGEFWATQPKEARMKKAMEDAKFVQEYAKAHGHKLIIVKRKCDKNNK